LDLSSESYPAWYPAYPFHNRVWIVGNPGAPFRQLPQWAFRSNSLPGLVQLFAIQQQIINFSEEE